jgi:hypothetical protein
VYTKSIISNVRIYFDVVFGQHHIQSLAKSALKWMQIVSQKRHTKFETTCIVLKYLTLFFSLYYSYSSSTFDGLVALVRSH